MRLITWFYGKLFELVDLFCMMIRFDCATWPMGVVVCMVACTHISIVSWLRPHTLNSYTQSLMLLFSPYSQNYAVMCIFAWCNTHTTPTANLSYGFHGLFLPSVALLYVPAILVAVHIHCESCLPVKNRLRYISTAIRWILIGKYNAHMLIHFSAKENDTF